MNHLAKGAFHLHSLYSDGTGTIKEIAADAIKAGLDWIVITDHNSLEGLEKGEEGWYDGLALIIGNEISPDTKNHYLTVGLNKTIPFDLNTEDIIKTVKAQGGLGFVAHPDESCHRKNKYPPLRWENKDLRGFDGIEIWNFMSDWTDNYVEKIGVYCALARHHIVKGPPRATLKWWDDLNNETPEIISAIGGLDTHAFDFGFFKIFPYLDTFKTVTNYLCLDKKLSSDFNVAKQQILAALRHGSNIIVNRRWNKSEELCFEYDGSTLRIEIPQKAKIKVLRNGRAVLETKTKKLMLDDLSPGKYRFEAYYRNKPWIFSNPLLV